MAEVPHEQNNSKQQPARFCNFAKAGWFFVGAKFSP
jgi:hypothetical protein